MLKKQDYINKVIRIQKTERSLKTLKAIQLMKYKTHSLLSASVEDLELNLRNSSKSVMIFFNFFLNYKIFMFVFFLFS